MLAAENHHSPDRVPDSQVFFNCKGERPRVELLKLSQTLLQSRCVGQGEGHATISEREHIKKVEEKVRKVRGNVGNFRLDQLGGGMDPEPGSREPPTSPCDLTRRPLPDIQVKHNCDGGRLLPRRSWDCGRMLLSRTSFCAHFVPDSSHRYGRQLAKRSLESNCDRRGCEGAAFWRQYWHRSVDSAFLPPMRPGPVSLFRSRRQIDSRSLILNLTLVGNSPGRHGSGSTPHQGGNTNRSQSRVSRPKRYLE
ncbi:hypothetical protein IWX49DRAFT_384943 [Phyllosticta citricarpa]